MQWNTTLNQLINKITFQASTWNTWYPENIDLENRGQSATNIHITTMITEWNSHLKTVLLCYLPFSPISHNPWSEKLCFTPQLVKKLTKSPIFHICCTLASICQALKFAIFGHTYQHSNLSSVLFAWSQKLLLEKI